MLRLLESKQNKMGRKVNQCIDYILNDKDNLFAISRVKHFIAHEKIKNYAELKIPSSEKIEGTKIEEVNRHLNEFLKNNKLFILPTGIRAIKNVLNKNNMSDHEKLDKIKDICKDRLDTNSKNRRSSTAEFYNEVLQFIQHNTSLPIHENKASMNPIDVGRLFKAISTISRIREKTNPNTLIDKLSNISQNYHMNNSVKRTEIYKAVKDDELDTQVDKEIKKVVRDIIEGKEAVDVDTIVDKINKNEGPRVLN
ncbi:hypothetical protein Lgra_1416 [Legionella gratiana]|uniref:Phosphoinositide phosphatase C-terminal domain-containing protein n=2 Tax=Legionella gratiana TaxID=45066 RepID=A0A378JHN9_9GAMM|nr:hypothetical protein Lgra_1416 [Legionella gratiana]STX46438.1 Uncharacterised protein [Legionella gratiana]